MKTTMLKVLATLQAAVDSGDRALLLTSAQEAHASVFCNWLPMRDVLGAAMTLKLLDATDWQIERAAVNLRLAMDDLTRTVARYGT